MILTLSLFSMMNLFADATGYNKTYYNVQYTALTSVDDAYYLIGYEFSNNSTLGYLKSSSYDTYTGFRFSNINIPTTAIIDSAYISLYGSDAIDNKYYSTTIKGINNVNSTGFNTYSDLYSITLLSHYVNWEMKDLEGGVWANSSDIKTVLTDIIQLSGWVTNNSVSFRFDSAQSTTGTRSFRTYDHSGITYAPKLYIRYYVLTPITEEDPPTSIIDEYNPDVIILLDNDTDTGYLTWMIYNNTDIQSYFVFDDTNNLYKILTSSGWHTIASSADTPDFRSRKSIDVYNGTLYCFIPILDGGSYDLWLYKSIDNGLNWTQLIMVYDNAAVKVSTSMDITSTSGVIYLAYLRSGTPKYKTYTIATATLSDETALTFGAQTFPSTIEMLVNSDATKRIAVYDGRGVLGSGYAAYWDGAAWQYIGIVEDTTYTSVTVSCALFEDGHAYFAKANYMPYVEIYDLYLDTDFTYTRGTVTGALSENILDVEFEQDSSHILVTARSYNGAYAQYRLIKIERTGEEAGSYSSAETIIIDPVFWNGQIKYSAEGSQITTTNVNGYSYYTTCIGDSALTGLVSIEGGFIQKMIYYQTLQIGSTPPLYIITDEDGNIIWEGTTLPVVDDLPITATSVRNFLFITGLILLLAPMILWSVGGEYKSIMGIGIGLISMLIGLAFLMQITSIVL